MFENLRHFILLGLCSLYFCSPICPAADEIVYPGDDFAKLDTFEGLNLEDADKLFNKKDYKGAYAAYKAYSFEFPKSKALPYVLLRMGRCLHQLEKRNAAITAYQDVVDYFPDAVRYAAASARSAVVAHYTRRSPNHEKLMEFYIAASGFDGRGSKKENPEEDAGYWTTVLSSALKGGVILRRVGTPALIGVQKWAGGSLKTMI